MQILPRNNTCLTQISGLRIREAQKNEELIAQVNDGVIATEVKCTCPPLSLCQSVYVRLKSSVRFDSVYMYACVCA